MIWGLFQKYLWALKHKSKFQLRIIWYISMYVQDILCGISKVPFEILNKISCPYTEMYIYQGMELKEILESKAPKHVWNGSLELIKPWPQSKAVFVCWHELIIMKQWREHVPLWKHREILHCENLDTILSHYNMNNYLQSTHNRDQGPVSQTVFPSQFKLDGNFVSLSSRF